MILDKTVSTRITTSTQEYYKNLGYSFGKLGRKNQTKIMLEVLVEHLPKFTHVKVKCECNRCKKIYSIRLMKNTNFCLTCQRQTQKNRHKFKIVFGKDHPNHNPDLQEYKRYAYQIRQYTNKHFKKELQELIGDKKIGLCGTPDAYQIDHIISIKRGFYEKIPVEVMGDIKNIQIVTWEENRDKWFY